MPQFKRYYRMLGEYHPGCEEPTAYFIPFAADCDAGASRESSPYFHSLCGEWNFRWFENVNALPLEDVGFVAGVDCPDRIAVPGCWQLNFGRGYDVPNYINQDYPFPVDPPYLPDEIPCGLYRRSFDIDKKPDKKYYINFEGVSSCYYLYINGKFAAYSQVSHATSVCDITDYITSGTNTVEVLVVKHCTGSYLEDQDFFRLSGIFREAYILERDEKHIRDIEVKSYVSEALDSAEFTACITGVDAFEWSLCLEGETVASGLSRNGKVSVTVASPKLWNPEIPAVYDFVVCAGSEKISIPVGFKRFEIVNSAVLLNGRKIKCKGINRHDTNPETGYWVTPGDMKKDLCLLKQASVNCIRTSHYPNDPRFLEMCDRMGFMVVDEADIESHGMGYNFGDWYWDYWSFCSDDADWTSAYVDRAKLLYERDKNHPCVIMWSLGNESGCGNNHREMAKYIRSRDSRNLIHYENARLEYGERVGKDFSDISDVESRMYASLEYLEEYLADETLTKPFYYCEYVDSMSTGDIPLYWGKYEDNDKYFGGCVWEFADHAVNIGTKEKPAYRYGGDFGDWPNDNICCVDGLVHPDRTPRPGYFDMKKTYQPFGITFNGNEIKVFNRKYFASLSDVVLDWCIEKNGVPTESGSFGVLDIEARKEKTFSLPCVSGYNDGLVTLNLYFRLACEKEWAEKGFEIGAEQFVLCDSFPTPVIENGAVFEKSFGAYTVKCGKMQYTFDRILGVITSIRAVGKELLLKPAVFNMWRCATYNTRGYHDRWNRARYDHIKQKTYDCSACEKDGKVVITVNCVFASAAMPPAVKALVTYTFGGNGVTVKVDADVTYNAPALPRFSFCLELDKSFNKSTYLGFGPCESYAERLGNTRISEFATSPENDYEHYVKPQESCSHFGTRRASIGDDGTSLGFTAVTPSAFCWKAIPYTDTELHSAMHDDELPAVTKTVVNIDYKIHTTTENKAFPERFFNEKKFTFEFTITPEIR